MRLKMFENFDEEYSKKIENSYKRANLLVGNQDEVLWFDGMNIERYHELLKYCGDSDSILDYGCGLGILASEVNPDNYLGIDIQKRFIDKCIQEYPEHKFQHVYNLSDVNGDWDWFIASGAFTTGFNNFGTLDLIIREAMLRSRKGVAFNFLFDPKIKKLMLSFSKVGVQYNYYSLSGVLQYFTKKYSDCKVIAHKSDASPDYDNEAVIWIIK
jgi:SAM-dependent methyltransferase